MREMNRRLKSPKSRKVPAVISRLGMARLLTAGLGLGLATGCTVIDVKAEGHISSRNGWVLLPMQNLGETHLAGERVEELLSTLLRIKKGVDVAHYATSPSPQADSGKATKDGRDDASAAACKSGATAAAPKASPRWALLCASLTWPAVAPSLPPPALAQRPAAAR
jgi:hypothetical protein